MESAHHGVSLSHPRSRLGLLDRIHDAAMIALPGRFDRMAIVLCLLLGWSGVAAYASIASTLPNAALWLLLTGGALYSFGTLFHVWRRLRFHNAIWHSFVLAAASCHYSAVLACLARS
jgi:hemolysin III